MFLNLAKAFGTVSIPILLRKLELVGITGNVPISFNHLYGSRVISVRSQCVKVDQHTSRPGYSDFGIPQGSIQGPTLFTLYFDDIFDTLPYADMICYTDDTVIFFNDSKWTEVVTTVEMALMMMPNDLGMIS